MKSFFTSLAACLLMLTASAQRMPAVHSLLNEFENPDKQYRTAPLMVWNTDVSRYQLDNMLREFHFQGFGGVFIHPRMGLITEYLSPEWHELVKYTVERGRDFGLDVWLYDENSYPSGFAGGHVPREMPESYNEGEALLPTVVDRLPDDLSGYALILSERKGKFEDITEKAAKFKGKTGTFYVYIKNYYKPSAWMAGTSYVDLLRPGVTEKFMEVTMRGHEQTLGPELSKSVKGIFTDEPEIISPGGIRWTGDLFDVFENTYGYDLKVNLPLLHTQQGDWKKVRHDYFQLMLRLFVDRWAKPWYNYCEENDLIWTGHYWEHRWPNMTGVPDNMAMAAWQQMPGIDMLFNQFDETDTGAQFGNVRSVKEVRSVANQLGRERILCETYGGGGWNLTFKDMKRLADWQFALGVNFVNQHHSHMSQVGIRKFDYPPMFTRAASWWNDYRVLNDYIARMSTTLSMGEQINDILVIEPTTTVWMYNSYINDLPEYAEAKRIGQSFQKLVTDLEKAQVEFDLGCEEIIRDHGSLRQNHLIVGQIHYGTVVISEGTENLEKETFELLKDFVDGGGRLVAFGIPTRIEGVVSPKLAYFFSRPEIVKPESLTAALRSGVFQSDGIVFEKVKGGNLYHQRRQFADGQTLFLTNVSLDEPTEVTFEIDGRNMVRLDGLDGKAYEISYQENNGKITATLNLQPVESALLLITDKPVATACKRALTGQFTVLEPYRPLTIERGQDNVLVLDFVDLECGGDTHRDIFYHEAAEEIFRKAGLDGHPWYRSIQYGKETVNTDLSQAPGFKVSYKFTITDDDVDMSSMRMVVENPNLYTVKINGNRVYGGYYWLVDENFKYIGIGAHVKKGENIIELSAEHPTVFTEIAAVCITGNFDVKQQNDRWVITPAATHTTLTDWITLGSPFYAWDMKYSKFYNVRDTAKTHYLEASDYAGILAQVWINDRKVGVLFSEPYKFDMTDHLVPGANKVELRVIGGMENFLGPHHRPYDGYAGPDRWMNIKQLRTASQYNLTPYGLRKDFIVYESE